MLVKMNVLNGPHMTRTPAHLLVLAATPALLASLLLMHFAGASRGLLLQQAVVALVGAACLQLAASPRQVKAIQSSGHWLLFALAAILLATLAFGESTSPHRWVVLGSVRLYVAAIVLPAFLLIWHQLNKSRSARGPTYTIAAVLVGLALLTQPDAAQLSAFSLAALPILGVSTLARIYKIIVAAALLVAAAFCWGQPDPLAPVRYVEGVFFLASEISVLALIFAVLAAALPVVALAWLARSWRSVGLMSVAIYYATLYGLSPLQITPVPLLGFGASPILGYFLVSTLALRVHLASKT